MRYEPDRESQTLVMHGIDQVPAVVRPGIANVDHCNLPDAVIAVLCSGASFLPGILQTLPMLFGIAVRIMCIDGIEQNDLADAPMWFDTDGTNGTYGESQRVYLLRECGDDGISSPQLLSFSGTNP